MGKLPPKERKIHIALPGELHQLLRIKCAVEDLSIQEFVQRLVSEAVKDIRVQGAKEKVR